MKKIFSLILVGIILFCYFWRLDEYINLSFIQHNLDIITIWINNNPILSVISYIILYSLILVTYIPIAALLTISAGWFFGLYWGTLLAVASSCIGATLSFLIARHIFKDYFQNNFTQLANNINKGLQGKNAYSYLFFLRLNPLFSFTLLNPVLGLTNISLKTYIITTMFGSLLGTIIYVNAGRSLTNITSMADIFHIDVVLSFSALSLLPFIISSLIAYVQRLRLYKPFNKPKQYDYDMVVIGAGAAGLVSAYMGAFFKAKVALIEEHKMGGDCLNTGCVPSKALINYANDFHIAKKFNPSLTLNFDDLKHAITQAIDIISPKDSARRYETLGVHKVILGKASIVSPFEIRVKDAIITTKNIIIATGGSPFIPTIDGLSEIDYLTSNNLWNLTQLPSHLVILGSGVIAIELGIAFAKLGSKVTIIEKNKIILTKQEDEVRDMILNQFNNLGITLLLNSQITLIKKNNQTNILTIQNHVDNVTTIINCSHLLIAIGRKPRVSNLGLPSLKINEKQAIEVNDYLQTNYKNIYACGDAISRYQLTHVAGFEAPFAVINLLFGFIKKIKISYRAIPSVIYSSPDVAQVGLTSKEAMLQNIPHDIIFEHIHESDGAILSNQQHGFIKIIINKKSKHILGVTICAKNAGMLIAEYTMAIRLKLKINAIHDNIYAYPTINDIGKIALQKYRATLINKRIFTLFKILHKIRNIL